MSRCVAAEIFDVGNTPTLAMKMARKCGSTFIKTASFSIFFIELNDDSLQIDAKDSLFS